MNIENIIDKYQNTTKLYDLADGSAIVVGQEIDQNNMLVYILKQNDVIIPALAVDCTVIPVIHPSEPFTVTVVAGQTQAGQ